MLFFIYSFLLYFCFPCPCFFYHGYCVSSSVNFKTEMCCIFLALLLKALYDELPFRRRPEALPALIGQEIKPPTLPLTHWTDKQAEKLFSAHCYLLVKNPRKLSGTMTTWHLDPGWKMLNIPAIGSVVLIKIPHQSNFNHCRLHTAPTYFIYHSQAASDAGLQINTVTLTDAEHFCLCCNIFTS